MNVTRSKHENRKRKIEKSRIIKTIIGENGEYVARDLLYPDLSLMLRMVEIDSDRNKPSEDNTEVTHSLSRSRNECVMNAIAAAG